MKKILKSTISLTLSLCLVFGLFACIPAVSAAAGEMSTDNVVFLDTEATNATVPNTAELSKKLSCVNTASAYPDTGLQMTALTQTNLSAKYDNSKNLVQSAKTILSDGTTTTVDTEYYKNGYIYDDAATTDSVDSDLKGANFLSGHIYTGTKNGVERIAEGGYDLRLVFDLGETTLLDSLYLFSFVRKNMNITTYKLHVGDSEANLFSNDTYVLYWDYYKGYAKNSNSYMFNGNYTTGYKRSEGQVWTFSGEEKPCGRYIGIEIVDAAYDTANTANYFYLYEIGAYGTQVSYLEYSDKDVTNDISSSVDLDTKLELLKAESKVLGTKLRMTAMDKDYVNNITAHSPNLIKSAKIKNYTDTAFKNVDSNPLKSATDGGIVYGNGTSLVNSGTNSYIGKTGKTGLFYDGSDETIGDVHGADRVSADVYDAMLTLDLGESTEIYDFYMFNHVNIHTAITTYKVYISDSEEDLYTSKNEVLYWDYFNGYYDTEAAAKRSTAYLFNGIGTGYSELRRSEGQHWKFTQTKPKGRYVGVKVYEASTIANNDFLAIYEIGVLSAESYKLNFNHGEAVKVKTDSDYVEVGKTATFELLKAEEVKVTSVTVDGEEITATDGVYTIENVTADLEIDITTDADSRFPDAEGVYNGIDLTKNSSFYGTALWEGDTVYAETVTLYEGRNEISLAYPIDEIISVRSYDLQTGYTYGIDYTVNSDGKLVITADTSIPVCDNSEYDITNILQPGTSRLDYNAISYWKNKQYKYQIAVTYTHKETWGNDSLYQVKPEGKLSNLSHLYEKLKNGEEVDVVFYGDSTTLGWNASGLDEQSLAYNGGNDASTLSTTHATMHGVFGLSEVPDWACDTWAHQVVNDLAKKFGTKVNIINKAVGSSNSVWGSATQNLDFLLEGLEPDLMVIAYGGNDREYSSETMNTNITAIVDYVRAKTPDCDVVVPSTFKRGYPETGTGNLANHEVGYYELEETIDDLVVIPVHSYTESLMTGVKEHYDYTANGYNHMNDFGQRLYASVISGFLSEKEYEISFVDKFDKVFYTAKVSERNPVLTAEQLFAATTNVPFVYGYNWLGWNTDVEVEFDGDTEISAVYSRDTAEHETVVEDVEGNQTIRQIQFDQRFVVSDSDAKSLWVVNTVNGEEVRELIGSAEGVTLYGCGAIKIVSSNDEAPKALSVAVLKTIAEKVNGKNAYRVFIHVYNPVNENISELGILIAPGSAYVSDEAFKLENMEQGKYMTISTNSQTTDLLAHLNGVKDGVTRVVRGYAKLTEETVYSANVYKHTFN